MKLSHLPLLAACACIVVLSGCAQPQLMQMEDIGQSRAKEIALTDAGADEQDTTRLRITSEKDEGRSIYEVSFTVGGFGYEYDVEASSGTIIDVKRVAISEQSMSADHSAIAQHPQGSSERSASSQSSQEQAVHAVSLEQATQLALERVLGASEQDIRIKLDYDDGRWQYEGDIVYANVEYDFEIDAETGTFLEWSEDRR